jgi:[FeFe] hydrogenase H-cluster maturation GTPase HydF
MINTPKSMRLQIGIFGRTNVGKSSFLNMLANQDVAITSPVPGTTTDVVEKHMELLPIGPVTLFDTAGVNDSTDLSKERLSRTNKVIHNADVAVLVTEVNKWNSYEEILLKQFHENKIPHVIIINKIDAENPNAQFLKALKNHAAYTLFISATDEKSRNQYIELFKGTLLKILPSEFATKRPLLGDILPKEGVCLMIVPIDNEAPKGRLILPQVQSIRDALDSDAMSLVVKETGYKTALEKLKDLPALVVCDSQVVKQMVDETPDNVPCTTFSILFSRYKGDLLEEVKGLAALNDITKEDKVLIAEACTHHPNQDDIGRVKIPNWLERYLGFRPKISVSSGRDYPENINNFKMIIHCGGCMLTRNEKLVRIEKAKMSQVPITNYGILISHLNGVLDRVLSPFPTALEEYRKIFR